jgi:hypothetical protein
MPFPLSRRIIVDLLAFLIIVVKSKRSRARFPGIPSILDTILRGATIYFVVIFTSQLVLLLSTIFAPVSDTPCFRGKVTAMCSSYFQPFVLIPPGV